MKSVLLLRIASVVALLQFLAHTFLIVSYVPRHGPEETALVAAMKVHQFFKGIAPHGYWDLYSGYAFFASFNCLIEAVLFWQLAASAKSASGAIKPIVALFCFANLAYATLILKYFFLVPLFPDLAIALCLAVAYGSAPSADRVVA